MPTNEPHQASKATGILHKGSLLPPHGAKNTPNQRDGKVATKVDNKSQPRADTLEDSAASKAKGTKACASKSSVGKKQDTADPASAPQFDLAKAKRKDPNPDGAAGEGEPAQIRINLWTLIWQVDFCVHYDDMPAAGAS